MSYQSNVKKSASLQSTIPRNSVEYLRTLLFPSPNTPSPTRAIPSLWSLVYWRNEIQMEKYWHKLDRGSLIKTLCITHQLLLLLWWQPQFLPDSLGLKGGWTLGEQVDFSNLSVPLTFPVSLTSPTPTSFPPASSDDADRGYQHPQAIVISIWLWAQSFGSTFFTFLTSQSPFSSIPPSHCSSCGTNKLSTKVTPRANNDKAPTSSPGGHYTS